MTTRRYHSQHFIDNHVYERFLGHGHVPHQTQQGGSLVQKLSVHQSDSLVQQLQQGFPSPPHASNETPQRRVLFHRYPSLTLDDVARVEGSLLGTLCNLLSVPSPFLWVFLDVGLAKRSFFTLSGCSPCVKGSMGSVVVVVVGASVAVVSTVRLDMLHLVNVVSLRDTSYVTGDGWWLLDARSSSLCSKAPRLSLSVFSSYRPGPF